MYLIHSIQETSPAPLCEVGMREFREVDRWIVLQPLLDKHAII